MLSNNNSPNILGWCENLPVHKISTPGKSLLPTVVRYSDAGTSGTARDAQYSAIYNIKFSYNGAVVSASDKFSGEDINNCQTTIP